jgi:hypothetical protein
VIEMERQEEQSQKGLNSWNLEHFQSTINTIKQRPEAGKLIFHTLSRWDEGFAVDGRTQKIEMIDKTFRQKFTLRGDHHHYLFEGTERFFKPSYVENLTTNWIPALEGIEDRLKNGGAKVHRYKTNRDMYGHEQ